MLHGYLIMTDDIRHPVGPFSANDDTEARITAERMINATCSPDSWRSMEKLYIDEPPPSPTPEQYKLYRKDFYIEGIELVEIDRKVGG